MIELLGAEQPQPRIYFEIVTGTHSSGKTTVVESFIDEDYCNELGLTEAWDCPYVPHFGASHITVDVDNKTYHLPVVTVEEASTAYVRKLHQPELLTDSYSFEHQIMMESFAYSSVIEAREIADRAARSAEKIPLLGHCALVLSDRFTSDGVAYSKLRTPDQDQEAINLNTIEDTVLGWRSVDRASRVYPLRKWNRSFLIHSCDMIFQADHTETTFEDNGLRLIDATFREDIAREIRQMYTTDIGRTLMPWLRGDTAKRKETIRLWTERILQLDIESVTKSAS